MKTATISEAKDQLSRLIQLVKRGETVLILDRRRPVARLEGVGSSRPEVGEDRLVTLERDGVLRRARKRLTAMQLKSKPPRLKGGASALKALLQERALGR